MRDSQLTAVPVATRDGFENQSNASLQPFLPVVLLGEQEEKLSLAAVATEVPTILSIIADM